MTTAADPIDTLRDQIGALKGAHTVAEAVMARLRLWGPAYCEALGVTPWRGVLRLEDLLDYPENNLPALVVLVPGTIGEPVRHGDGYYSATYSVMVTAVALAATQNDTRRVAELENVAARGCLIHNRMLAEDVTTELWVGETTDNLTVNETQRLLMCTSAFTVRLEDVVSWRAGPDSGALPPDVEPWPVATDVELTITKVS